MGKGKDSKKGKKGVKPPIDLLASANARATARSLEGAGKDTPLRIAKPQKGVAVDNFAGRDAVREEFRAVMPDGTIETHWLPCPPDEKRCTGNILNGPYAGQRCRKPPLMGARVCLSHGGQLPAVRRAAERRLLASQDLAVRGVLEIAFAKSNVKDSDRLKAMQMLMDRGGLDAKQTIQLEVKPYEAVMERALLGKPKKGKGKKHKVIDGDLAEAVGTETFDHWVEAPEGEGDED